MNSSVGYISQECSVNCFSWRDSLRGTKLVSKPQLRSYYTCEESSSCCSTEVVWKKHLWITAKYQKEAAEEATGIGKTGENPVAAEEGVTKLTLRGCQRVKAPPGELPPTFCEAPLTTFYEAIISFFHWIEGQLRLMVHLIRNCFSEENPVPEQVLSQSKMSLFRKEEHPLSCCHSVNKIVQISGPCPKESGSIAPPNNLNQETAKSNIWHADPDSFATDICRVNLSVKTPFGTLHFIPGDNREESERMTACKALFTGNGPEQGELVADAAISDMSHSWKIVEDYCHQSSAFNLVDHFFCDGIEVGASSRKTKILVEKNGAVTLKEKIYFKETNPENDSELHKFYKAESIVHFPANIQPGSSVTVKMSYSDPFYIDKSESSGFDLTRLSQKKKNHYFKGKLASPLEE